MPRTLNLKDPEDLKIYNALRFQHPRDLWEIPTENTRKHHRIEAPAEAETDDPIKCYCGCKGRPAMCITGRSR